MDAAAQVTTLDGVVIPTGPLCTVCGHAPCPCCAQQGHRACDALVERDGETDSCPCFWTDDGCTYADPDAFDSWLRALPEGLA